MNRVQYYKDGNYLLNRRHIEETTTVNIAGLLTSWMLVDSKLTTEIRSDLIRDRTLLRSLSDCSLCLGTLDTSSSDSSNTGDEG